MKNKFLKILGLVAGIGLGLVIVFQVILAMNTSAIKSSSPTAVNSATSNSSDKEIIAEALNTGMAANALTKYLNIKHGRLKDEYGIIYENKAKHSGRRVTLTLMPLEATQ